MKLRNIAIIAHVDHGKTTLVDSLLFQSGTLRANQRVAERALDSGDLERERGITILSKCTSVAWRDLRINIVDTPGHADFGAEVERILSMVDGVLVLVDAAEGPMPQTKFVTAKALGLGLRPIVVINKVDRPDARPWQAHEEVFDLFSALDADEAQLDFPVLFASAKQGWADLEPDGPRKDLTPLFEIVARHVPPPEAEPDAPFAMLVTTLEADPFLGRVLTGRIHSGAIRANTKIRALDRAGEIIEETRVTKLLAFRGLKRSAIEEAHAGDIVALAGFERASVADTLADPSVTRAMAAEPVDPPTLAVSFLANDSPLAGTEGSRLTSREIRARLRREAESNIAIRVTEKDGEDSFEVAGRGELQLGVLIETMRREGFELCIGRPRVLQRTDPESGRILEPIEEVQIDVDEEFTGAVVEGIAKRRGELMDMRPSGGGRTRLLFHAPSRGLIGYNGELLTATRGSAVMNRIYHCYQPHKGDIAGRRTGVLISNGEGKSVAFALWNLEERGPMFIGASEPVYGGMVIGQHTRGSDLIVNPLKTKQLTNIRAAGSDEAVRLTTPRRMSLEQAIAYIDSDELVEVTPKSVRIRKRLLDPHARKRAARAEAEAAD
ncbi:MAG: translational GTPase TypA [Alphaproteobacteria bacterium]|jgi:GTP-binding protein|nr:translational GTPase TypA [Alphaproteobacteria bacterium]MDP6590807.1 translational GTPase TypA [Alphaproteobacteria bacterium]MDP6818841.1 translational GTPase TypA [Alphaproteobacteria bacterium]